MATVRFTGNFLDGKTECFSADGGLSIERIIREHSTGDEFSSEMVECYDLDTGETFYAPIEDDSSVSNAVAVVNGKSVSKDYIIKEDDVVSIVMTPAGGSVGDWIVAGVTALGVIAGATIGTFILGPIGTVLGGIGGGILGYNAGKEIAAIFDDVDTNSTTNSGLSSDSQPDIRGASNQALTDNPIPAVIGKHLATPFIVGSPWNEISGKHGDTNYIHCLYAVGYAPLRLTDFKLGDMYLAHNQPWSGNESLDNVFTGTLHGTDGNKGEIVNTWSSNDITIEILQQHQDKAFSVNYGSIYPDAKVQQDISANVLYILDNSLAENDVVSYRGAGLENGLRNNVVRFTEQYPYEIRVELDFSQGLYKSYTKGTSDNSSGESYTQYDRIPMWVAIQWRPYSEDNDASDGNESGVFNIPSYDSSLKSYKSADGKNRRPWVSFGTVNGEISAQKYTEQDNWNDKNAHTGNHLSSGTYNSEWVGAEVFNLQSLGFSAGKNYSGGKEGLNEFRCVTSVNLKEWAETNLRAPGDSDSDFAEKFRSYFYDTTNTAKSIEVRVVRLSPNYIDETVSRTDDGVTTGAASYSELFTWKTLTTTILDADSLENSRQIATRKPLSEEKMRKMCLVAIKAKTDSTDQIGSSLKKLTCTAQSFSPYYDTDTGKWVPENILKTSRYFKPATTDEQGKIIQGEEITKEQYETDRQNGVKSVKYADGNDFTHNIAENVILTESHFKKTGNNGEAQAKLFLKWTYKQNAGRYIVSGASVRAEFNELVSELKAAGTLALAEDKNPSPIRLSFTKSGEEKSIPIASADITQSSSYEEEITEIVCGTEEGTGRYETVTDYFPASFILLAKNLTVTYTAVDGETSEKELKGGFTSKPNTSTSFFSDSFNLSTERYCLPGDDGTLRYCGNNAASMFLLSAVGAHAGRDALGYVQSGYETHGSGDFDMESLAEWHEWAEDVTDGSTYSTDGYHYDKEGNYVQHSQGDTVHMRFTANAYMYKSQQLKDILSKIAIAGRATYTKDSANRIKVIVDKEESYPVAMITQQNTLKSSGTLSYSELPSGLQIPFSDENDGYVQNTIYCMKDGETADSPNGNIEQYSIEFVTNNLQAWSLGRYLLACRLLSRESITKQIGPEGASIELGDVVLVQDDNMLIGTDNGGRITSLVEDSGRIYGFIIDNTYRYTGETETDENGESVSKQGVMIMQPSQYGSSRIVTIRLASPGTEYTAGGETFTAEKSDTSLVLFSAPISKSGSSLNGDDNFVYKPEPGNIVAFGEIKKITEQFRVTNIKEDEKHHFTLTMTRYTPELYSYGRSLPTFQNNMTVPDRSGEDAVVLEEKDLTAIDLKNIKAELEEKIKGTENSIVSSEDTPLAPLVAAAAGKDGIQIACTPQGLSLSNTVKSYTAAIYRGADDTDGVRISSASPSFTYTFRRGTDGYPEADELKGWRVKAKAVSIYGNESDWSAETAVDVSSYSTWKAPPVSVSYLTAGKDGLKAGWSLTPSLTYGDVRYTVSFLYDGKAAGTIQAAMQTQAEYTFDRDSDKDGYPEKTAVNAKLEELGIETKGRSVELYSVKVSAYTLQKPDDQQADEMKCNAAGYGTWVPGSNSRLTARASQDGITAEMETLPSSAEYGTPYRYEFGVRKSEEGGWETATSDSPLLTRLFSGEYPEADDLLKWSVRCRAVSVCGIPALSYRETSPDTTGYGTWLLEKPNVATRVSARSITLVMSLPAKSAAQYGTTRYRIQIRKPGTDAEGEWFRPGLSLDPYADESNYKDGEGYIETGSVYVQTMPLAGQSSRSISDTLYQFRVSAVNEAHESEANSGVFATAVCTSIDDIVKANETAKSAYISELSAITANLGTIRQGSLTGNDRNYWNLSTLIDEKTGEKRWQGAMRVGGDDQYLEVRPIIVNGEISGYDITFKVGNFEISSTASNINGELVIMKSASALDRTRITPEGTFYEHRETESSDWLPVSQMTTAAIITSAAISDRSLILTNMGIQERRLLGHDIGRPYLSDSSRVWHFDTDLNDQRQESDLEIASYGEVSLVGSDTKGNIDYTPAILAVAPYSETARSLFGQYQLRKSIEATSTLTVDFWMQYIWCEDQILFDIGTVNDRIRLTVANREPYWNEPGEDEVPWNQEQVESGDVVVWNEPGDASTAVSHYGKSNPSPDADNVRTFSQLGISFEPNTWMHIGIVLTADKISVFINKTEVSFVRYEKAEADIDLTLNVDGDTLKNTFVLDELMIDTKTAESLADFARNTDARIPWGALSSSEKHFILDAEGLETNIFESEKIKALEKRIKTLEDNTL